MSPRFFSFSLLIGLGALLGHLYLYRRLVRVTVQRRGLRLLAIVVLGLLTLLLMNRRAAQQLLHVVHADAVSVVTYTWMGVALCLVLGLLAVDLTLGLLVVTRWLRGLLPAALPASGVAVAAPAPGPGEASAAPLAGAPTETPVDEERRHFLTRTLAGGALVAGGGLAAYGSWRAFAEPQVTEVAIRVPRLPRELDGLTLVQLTDIHVGPFIRRRFMDELVRRANALRPDLVAITGDLVDGDVPTLGDAVAALGGLRARHGSFFVTGNHEYYSGEEAWTAFLEGLGVSVLRNRRVSVGDAGASFDLVGVDDWSGGRRRGRKGYDLDLALAGRDAERAAVLLAHQPANFKVAAERGVDVQVSGHTHGGQLFPMTLAVGMAWEHSAGLYRHGDAHLYVSRGCGFWGPPMRLGSPPEIVKLVLTA